MWSVASPSKRVTFDFLHVARLNIENVSGRQVVKADGVHVSTFHTPMIVALPCLADAQRRRSQKHLVVFLEWFDCWLHDLCHYHDAAIPDKREAMRRLEPNPPLSTQESLML